MKMKSYISAVAIASLAMGFNSCTKDFDEINTDPDAYSTAPVSNILGYTIYQIASNYGNELYRLSDWSGYLANSQIETYQYIPTHNEFGYRWYTTYTCIPQLQDILDRTTPEDNKNMQNVAKLLQQYLLFLAADCYGDIPYTEACKGISDNIIKPVYDKDSDVYDSIAVHLKEISDSWAEGLGDDALGSGDLIYSGDAENWQRFCNSLRLRLAMRVSNMESKVEASKATFKEILSDPEKYPFIEDCSQNNYFYWLTSSSYRDPWYSEYISRPSDYTMAQVFVDRLKDQNDPRISVICRPAALTGEYRGVYHGSNAAYNSDPIGNYSTPGVLYRATSEAECSANPGFSPFFRAAESWFLIAEAAIKGWDTGSYTAQTAYETAVKCSMEDNGVSDDDASAYLAAAGSYDGTLKQIYLEEWVALYKQCQEAWSLYRRTGSPTQMFVEVDYSDGIRAPQYPGEHCAWGYGASARHNDLPFRFPYPSNEFLYNSDNVNAASEGIEDYTYGKRICWALENGRK